MKQEKKVYLPVVIWQFVVDGEEFAVSCASGAHEQYQQSKLVAYRWEKHVAVVYDRRAMPNFSHFHGVFE